MTTVIDDRTAEAPTPRPDDAPASSRHRSLVIAAVALALGLGVGRFLTFGAGSSVDPAPPVALSATDRIAELEAATFERPDDPAAWEALGTAYVRQAILTGDPAFHDLAARGLDRAAELDPERPGTAVARGTLALTLHDFATARALAEDVLDDQPDHRGALTVLVDAQVELGDLDAAAETLQRRLDIRPDLPALARVSYLRQLAGDLDGALVAIRRARDAGAGLPADTARIAVIEGQLLLTAGDADGALAAFEAAERSHPGVLGAGEGRARALHLLGEHDDALNTVESLLDRQPTADAAILAGELRSHAGGDPDSSFALARAIHDLQAASSQDVDLETALFEADHGDADLAVQLAEAARDDRRTIFTADALGWALHRAGRSEAAAPLVDEALAGGTIETAIRIHAVIVYDAVGRDADARRLLDAAVDRAGYLAPSLATQLAPVAAELGVDLPAQWR